MLVEEIMVKDIFTVQPTTTLKAALELTKRNNIRHLPVVNSANELLGIVSDRDLRSATPPEVNSDNKEIFAKVTMEEIMQQTVLTVHPLDFIEEAARLLYEYKIGCLPVVKGKTLVGIVTETDILRTLIELLGFFKEGTHLEVEVPHRPGSLGKLAEIVGAHGVNIDSVLLANGTSEETRTIILRVRSLDIRKILEDISQNGYTIKWPLKPGEYRE